MFYPSISSYTITTVFKTINGTAEIHKINNSGKLLQVKHLVHIMSDPTVNNYSLHS